ncbi:MAG TPA: DUF1385 domain-containing protein [Ktedonobacteraceae bacterium]|nr:DUF1385 domain-containing protein [Ktedonobacteraceae bacterium]
MATFYYGGQAVMEGVMMRGRVSAAMAVRKPDNSIYLYEEALNPRLYQSTLFRLPFLRGMLLLWQMLVLGTRLMTLSANIATGALDPDDAAPVEEMPLGAPTEAGQEMPGRLDAPPQIGGIALIFTLLVSLGFAVAVFFLGPLLITGLLHNQIGVGLLSLLIEGVIRLALLIGYLYVIGRIPDIQRVFGYHGAEHKAINAMEHGDPLDIPHVRRASRVHTRCGTGFLLLVVVVSIFVFALVGSPSLFIKVISRIVLVPVVAGIAYELMRLGAANYCYRVVRWLLAPGLALQGLTTREPDDEMIECAIAALRRVMRRDDQGFDAGPGEPDAALPPLVVSN